MSETGNDQISDLSVLYVEDETVLRDSMRPFIESMFQCVYTASDGAQGLRLFREYRPDIVITDIRMPGMDGLEMSEEIRKIDLEVPIIVLSAFSNQDNLIRAVNIGIDGFVEKTFSPDDFMKPLHKHARIQIQKRELDAAKNLLEQYKKVVDAGSPVLKIGPSGRIKFINDAFCMLTGFSEGELSGRHVYSLLHDRSDVDSRAVITEIRKANHWKGLVRIVSKSGETLCMDTVIVPVRTTGGDISELIALCHDITDFMKTKEALEVEKEKFKQLSITDALTGIFNRQEFNTAIIQEADRVNRYGELLSLIVFDIDFFKKANDDWGHQVGDRILIGLTRIVSGAIRRLDKFARTGGEEFAILMPSTTLAHAGFVAEKIRKLIETATSTEAFNAEIFSRSYPGTIDPSLKHAVTCSFGVAQMEVKEPVEAFFKRADDALYEAKHRGRNQVVLSESGGEFRSMDGRRLGFSGETPGIE